MNNLGFQIFSWIGTIFSLLGNIQIIRKNKNGFIYWIIGSAIMLGCAIYTLNYSQCVLFIIYEVFNVIGLIKWSDD